MAHKFIKPFPVTVAVTIYIVTNELTAYLNLLPKRSDLVAPIVGSYREPVAAGGFSSIFQSTTGDPEADHIRGGASVSSSYVSSYTPYHSTSAYTGQTCFPFASGKLKPSTATAHPQTGAFTDAVLNSDCWLWESGTFQPLSNQSISDLRTKHPHARQQHLLNLPPTYFPFTGAEWKPCCSSEHASVFLQRRDTAATFDRYDKGRCAGLADLPS
jgi:hypothetical protein